MKQNPIAVAATYTMLAGLAFVLLFPLLYAISGSLMTAREISTYPPAFFPSQPRLNNFVDVLRALPIPRQYLNSLIVAACVMVGQLATSILSAYAFAFLRMPFRNLSAVPPDQLVPRTDPAVPGGGIRDLPAAPVLSELPERPLRSGGVGRQRPPSLPVVDTAPAFAACIGGARDLVVFVGLEPVPLASPCHQSR